MAQMSSDGRRRLLFGSLFLLAVLLVGVSISWWPDGAYDRDAGGSGGALISNDEEGGGGQQRPHGDDAALPGDSEPTIEESQEYAKLIATQVDAEVEEAEAETEEEVLVDENSSSSSSSSSSQADAPETPSPADEEEEKEGEEEEEEPAAIDKHVETFKVPTLKAGFHTRDYSSSPPPKDKVFAGSVRWKQEAAIRLQRQSLALSRAKPAKDLSAPLRHPCRPISLALEGLVDTRPRNKPFHKCRRNHDDNPLFAVALVLRQNPHGGVTSSSALHAAVDDLKKLARQLGGTRLKAGAEVMLMFDGLWPDAKVLASLQKKMQAENDWFFVSRKRHGDVKQLNKLIRGSRARRMLVLRQEDWMGDGDSPGGARVAMEQLVEWVKAGKLAMDANPDLAVVSAAAPGPRGQKDSTTTTTTSSDGDVIWSDEVTHTPLLVNRVPVVNLGGLEEWGTCADETLSGMVASELAVRAWRGGLNAGTLAAGKGVASELPEHRKRMTKADGAWPFVVPGMTRDEKKAAGDQINKATANSWQSFYDPEVAGNCVPPDVDDNGRAPSSAASCGHAPSYPVATFVMQYFRRPKIINQLLNSLKTISLPIEIIINDDSRSELDDFTKHSKSPVHYDWYLALLNDVHEIRGYNRLALMGSAELVVLIQDDDSAPKGNGWLVQALKLFNGYPALGMLGGYRGRIDNGKQQIKEQKQNNGEKYGSHPEKDKAGRTKHLRLKDERAGVPMMWMYKVNLAPLVIRRSLFAEVGGFNANFSCAGQPGIGLDFELSIRLWKLGRHVALYDPNFKHGIGNSKNSGTHSGAARRSRNANEKRNNMMLYTMYPGYHHKPGFATSVKLNRQGVKQKQLKAGNFYGRSRRGRKML